MLPSVMVSHFEGTAAGCDEWVTASGLTGKDVADQLMLAAGASCDWPSPDWADWNGAMVSETLRDAAYVMADAEGGQLTVSWYPGDTLIRYYGGLPYGRILCPYGYSPSDPELYASINNGSSPLILNGLKCIYDPELLVPDKNRGEPDHCPVNNPINQATGNKFQIERDFEASGFQIFVERTYNSHGWSDFGLFGAGWTSNLDRRIIVPTDLGGVAIAVRPHGERIQFTEGRHDGSVIYMNPPSDVRAGVTRISGTDGGVTGWTYLDEDDSVENYDEKGRLTSITARSGLSFRLVYKPSGKLDYAEDNFGQRMTFVQDSLFRITQIQDPAQRIYKYDYDGQSNLTTVTYPDTKFIRHIYNEAAYTSGVSQPHAMTGIKDEKGIRFGTYTYDANGMAVATEHALHTAKAKVEYTVTDGMVTESKVTFGTAKPATYKTMVEGGTIRSTSSDRPCIANPTAKEIEWTYRGQVGYVKDFLDHERRSYFDERDNEYLRKEFVEDGKVVETNFEWHPRWRLLSKMTRGAFQVETGYDPVTSGLASFTISDTEKGKSRTWAYKTDDFGRVTEEDGPRTDVSDITSFTYYQANEAFPGQLKTVKNAAGHITTFVTYDALGNPLDIKDPNGVIVQLRYDPRYRLHTITRNGLVTKFDYDAVGQLETLTLPSKRSATYVYDNARRLTDIKLSDDARIHYTPDAEGNVKRSDVYDAKDKLVMTYGATFNGLRQVATITNGHNKSSTVFQDLVGNLTDVIGPGSVAVSMGYDALGRAKTFTQTNAGTITADYDMADQAWQIKDGNGYLSKLDLNLIGDVKAVSLPASDGSVLSQTPDDAGNVRSRTDFRGVAEQRDYDKLNRIKSRTAIGAPSIGFTYDEGANAKGRLTGLQDYSGATTFAYDKNGELSGVTRKYDGLTIITGLAHTSGNLTSVTYPSGRTVSYSYSSGQLRGVKINDADFITGVYQHPLGKIEGWSWASGATYRRTRDKDGLVDSYSLGNSTQTLGYDGNNRLETITDSGNAAYNQTFGHDLAGRVNGYKGLDATGRPSDQTYLYDLNGNRTTHRMNGTDYVYSYTPGNNYLETVPGPTPRAWLLTSQYTINDGTNFFALDAYGRIVGVTDAAGKATTTYVLNGLNQRVTKVMPSGAKTHYVYGPAGELLAELDKTGKTVKEYIWLPTEADGFPTLVGVSQGENGAVNQVFTDHLGTPRLVTAPSGDTLWRWVSDPFGGGAPIESGLKLNLRFAGQYFDSEHGYHYNWNRYYDPTTGRFAASDPIGLRGGFNTYAYAENDPLGRGDPSGLCPFCIPVYLFLVENSATLGTAALIGAEVWAGVPNPASGSIYTAKSAARGVHDAYLGLVNGERAFASGLRNAATTAGSNSNASAAACRAAAAQAGDFAVHFHHPYPQYLGGKFQQLLDPLPKGLHDLYHSGLDKILPRQIKGGATAYYESLSAAEKAANMQKFEAYTKEFDSLYGTNLWEGAIREGLLGALP